MHTPKSAFDEMCPKHGEIWTLTEDGWQCTRKHKSGRRYRDPKKTVPPLDVLDMHKVTKGTWFYYIGCLDFTIPLVSKAEKAKLDQEHTRDQLIAEKHRVAALQRDKDDHARHVVSELGDRMGVPDFLREVLKDTAKPEDMN